MYYSPTKKDVSSRGQGCALSGSSTFNTMSPSTIILQHISYVQDKMDVADTPERWNALLENIVLLHDVLEIVSNFEAKLIDDLDVD